MAKQKGKSVSFDAMVKFFMQYYGIPTKKDIDRMVDRLDRIENLVKANLTSHDGRRASARPKAAANDGEKSIKTATDTVLDVVKAKGGIGFTDIQSETGFEEKKLRNIIFRLNKLKKIRRMNRGMYEAV